MKEDNTYYDEMDGFNLPGSLRVHPFMVPENYFDHLPALVLSQARLAPISNPEKTGFTVPESYFSQLTDNIQRDLRVRQYRNATHREWGIPNGYFDDLSNKILSQTGLGAAKEQDVFDVPMDYFKNLAGHMHTKIFEDKLKEQVPTDGFTIPENYAGVLKDAIVAQTAGQQRQKTVVRRLNFNKWIPYVAAACVIIVFGVASYERMNKGARASFSESHLTTIADDEIINYLSALNDSHDILYIMECIDHDHSHDSKGICRHVKENDIEDYLNYAL